jgi:hypothetical protein
MAEAPDFTPISVAGNRVPGQAAVGANSNIAPNFNAGGWADNGPGTGGWDPKTASTVNGAMSSPSGSTDTSKYDMQDYQYPSDLMGNIEQYGNNYVVFYINVAIDSKLAKGPDSEYVNDIPRGAADGLVGIATRDPKATSVATTIGGAISGAAAGKVLSSAVGASGGLSSGIAAAGAVGGGVAIATTSSTFTAQKKRLKTAIALHIPNQLATRYGIDYGEESVAAFAYGLLGAQGANALIKAAEAKNFGNTDAGRSIAAAVASATLSVPGAEAISKLTGLAANPRKEQIFKNVDFRTFSFQYEFFPRDEQEAQYILNIIKQFKLHMHPEFKDANQFLYVYPSEFDIFYYNGSSENMNLNKHTSCVLTEMTVNYSPQGQFTSFPGGMPTQINIQLTFKELSQLTKDKIEEGF